MGTGKAYFNTEKLHTVSVNDLDQDYTFSMYPNPAQDNVTLLLDYPDYDKAMIEIYSASGERVYASEAQLAPGVNQQLLQVDGLKNGLYYLKITNEKMNLTQRLMVQ